mgnify:CR=1 FL=1
MLTHVSDRLDQELVVSDGICLTDGNLPDLRPLIQSNVRLAVIQIIFIFSRVCFVFKETVYLIAGRGFVTVFILYIGYCGPDRVAG